jgi:hypothetical protein
MLSDKRFVLIIFSILILAYSQIVYPQTPDFLEGKVINAATSRPVPFATIKLRTNQLGVYANADGDFRISRNTGFEDDSLIFTCIGYKQISMAYKDLSETVVNRIMLSPVVYGLSEVKITASRRKMSPLALIRRAIRSIENNYPDKPFSFIGYYRDYQKRDSNYINLNEAIVQTLDAGFSTESVTDKYRLLDFRKNTDFPRINITPYYDLLADNELNNPKKTIPNAILGDQYGNELFVLMVHDAIRNFNVRSFSFVNIFSNDFTYNHIFAEPVTVLNNNMLLSKISFTGRPFITGDSLAVSGAIYIQPKDFSIHKLEYAGYSFTKKKEQKQIYSIDIEYGYENTAGSKMCLKYISFNNIFKLTDSTDNTYFRVLNSYVDTSRNIKPTIIVKFNNKIDRISASNRENYSIKAGKREVKINSIQVVGKTLYLRFKKEDVNKEEDNYRIMITDVKDVDGNVVNKLKKIELYQYREFFVQDYNKTLPFLDSCFIQFLPLEQNCISKFSGNFNYWMNTPENIKKLSKN